MGLESFMRTVAALVVAIAMGAAIAAQETKPVPKDSVRVFVPGCTKGYMFTGGRLRPTNLEASPSLKACICA